MDDPDTEVGAIGAQEVVEAPCPPTSTVPPVETPPPVVEAARPRCLIEVESSPSRLHVRFSFQTPTDAELLAAGVLSLAPEVWTRLEASIRGWAEVEVVAIRQQEIWRPEVVERLLRLVGADLTANSNVE